MSEDIERRKYHSVNSSWPDGTNDGRDLKPTAQEAMSAARRLYRLIVGKPFSGKVKLTSGNRYTAIRSGVLRVNPDWRGGGWHELVHTLSHHLAWKLHRFKKTYKGHGHHHAWIERQMIDHVVKSGWLEGKLKRPEKPKVEKDVKAERRARVEESLARWEAKLRRAERAVRKQRKRLAYYERATAQV